MLFDLANGMKSWIVWGKIDFKFACKIKYELYEMTIYPCADLNA